MKMGSIVRLIKNGPRAVARKIRRRIRCRNYVHVRQGDVAETLRHIEAFTEGFFLYDGVLYESSGRKDSSFVYRYSDGYRKDFDKVFLEGSVIWKDRMFLLTYRDHVAYVLDKETFEIIRQYPYPREGWGLTTDGEYLIASNGSDRLFYMDEEFNTVRTVEVRDAGRPVRNINEPEYV